ncbi:hypothetical protein MGAST_19970, partial [Mycobacterium gastri 'Wayne']
MRAAVTGASGVLGRGLVARLLSQGHQVIGIARHRPESWPSAADFVTADIRDAAAVRRAISGADVVAHCAWARSPGPDSHLSQQVNIDGTRNILEAMSVSGTGRIVFASSAHVYRTGEPPAAENSEVAPGSIEGRDKARVEQLLADSGAKWVAVRSALMVGRSVDNWVRRVWALPVFPDGSADSVVQVVHIDDVLRLLIRTILGTDTGVVNLAAAGQPTFRQIAAALGRPVLPVGSRALQRVSPFSELALVQGVPMMDTSRLHHEWGFRPAWTAEEAIQDFVLAVRGRVCVGRRSE